MGRGDEWDRDAGTSNTGTRGRQIQGRKGTRVGILDPGGIFFLIFEAREGQRRAKVILNSF